MVGKGYGKIILALVIALAIVPSFAQKKNKAKEEDIVRLVKAESIEQVDIDGEQFRKSVAATFIHNGMTLSCDTALWNLDKEVINAFGHVKIRQDKVVLTSDKLDYDIQLEVATFRGSLVEMKDNNKNVLRTENLDYYTGDSLAVFREGASMRSGDGEIIESNRGTYSAKEHMFTFSSKVNMFTDSVLILTETLRYYSDDHVASFPDPVDFWKGDNMLSAMRGWYDRSSETFYFERSVHAMSPDQEVWCDSMYYYRMPNDVMMLGNVQMQDTSRNIMAVSEYMLYEDSLQQITLRDQAAVAMQTEHNGIMDTVYCGGEEIVYHTVKRYLIPENEVNDAKDRLYIFANDPIGTYRKEAADAAAQKARELYEKKMEEEHPGWKEQQQKLQMEAERARQKAVQDSLAAVKAQETADKTTADSLKAASDSLTAGDSLSAANDSLKLESPATDSLAVTDSLAGRDTTAIGFLSIKGKVQVFRQDLQVLCDSLEYTDLDSIARFYKDPIIWNEGNRQYSSDSLFALIRNGTMDRAALESNALILTQEDENLFDQIKSTEVMAYFNSKTELVRFDALGGANLLFFLEENDAFATANRVESKMLSGTFKDSELQRVSYYTETKNNAFPVAQMSEKERRFEGFNWSPEKRPKSKEDITTVPINSLERDWYMNKPRPSYPISERYFPGYMNGVLYNLEHPAPPASEEMPVGPLTIRDTIPEGDIMAVPVSAQHSDAGEPVEVAAPEEAVTAVIDTVVSDSIAVRAAEVSDSVAVSGSGVATDAVEEAPVAAVTGIVAADATSVAVDAAAEQKALQEAERKRKADERAAARAEKERKLNERDAARDAAKAQKELEKQRKKKERQWVKQQKRISREQDILYKYVERYEKQRQRKMGKAKDVVPQAAE